MITALLYTNQISILYFVSADTRVGDSKHKMDRIGILVGTAATAAVAAVAGYAMLRRSKQAYTLLKDLPPGVEDFKELFK